MKFLPSVPCTVRTCNLRLFLYAASLFSPEQLYLLKPCARFVQTTQTLSTLLDPLDLPIPSQSQQGTIFDRVSNNTQTKELALAKRKKCNKNPKSIRAFWGESLRRSEKTGLRTWGRRCVPRCTWSRQDSPILPSRSTVLLAAC